MPELLRPSGPETAFISPRPGGLKAIASVGHRGSCSYRFPGLEDYFQFANKKTEAKKRDFFEPDC